jgi:hypothetical protein
MQALVGWVGASTPPPAQQVRWRDVLLPAVAGLCIGLVFLVAGLKPSGFSSTGPFMVGAHWGLAEGLAERGVQVTVASRVGYDGQWFLALAEDPLLRGDLARRFDNPRYRAGRPLQSWLGWLLGAGRPVGIPLALLAIGPLAVGLGCAATARIVGAFGRRRSWGLAFAFVPGVGVGVALATAEPLALALAAVGVSLALDRRAGLAGLAFAGAALTKETYLAFAVAAGLHLVLVRPAGLGARLRAAVLALAPGVAALAGWWVYLVGQVPALPDRGVALNVTAPLGLPLSGWPRWLWVLGHYSPPTVPDAPGPAGAAFVAASLALIAAGVVLGLRRRSLPARCALILGGYATLIGGPVVALFYSAMRILAPCVFAALLAVATEATTRPRPNGTGGRTSAAARQIPRGSDSDR